MKYSEVNFVYYAGVIMSIGLVSIGVLLAINIPLVFEIIDSGNIYNPAPKFIQKFIFALITINIIVAPILYYCKNKKNSP